MINTETMTMSEMFGYMMAARGITKYSSRVTVIKTLVDTSRQASKELADVAEDIIYDFTCGDINDYMGVLSDEPGEYVNPETGEVISVQMIP